MKRTVKWNKGMTNADFIRAVVSAGGLTPGKVTHLVYAHDVDCPKGDAMGGRGECNCDPDVSATVGGLPDYLDSSQ